MARLHSTTGIGATYRHATIGRPRLRDAARVAVCALAREEPITREPIDADPTRTYSRRSRDLHCRSSSADGRACSHQTRRV